MIRNIIFLPRHARFFQLLLDNDYCIMHKASCMVRSSFVRKLIKMNRAYIFLNTIRKAYQVIKPFAMGNGLAFFII